MQSIAEQVQEKSIAVAVHTRTAIRHGCRRAWQGGRALAEKQRRRMAEETGQTVIEYAGILVLLAVLFVAIFGLHIGDKFASWANELFNAISNNSPSGGGGGAGGGGGGGGGGSH
jgi:Flp pilus assembly pilin Flp